MPIVRLWAGENPPKFCGVRMGSTVPFQMKSTPARITATVSSADPRVCAFTLDQSIFEGSSLCRNVSAAKGSPLFERLFALPGVAQVWVSGDRVTVACEEPQPWDVAAKSFAQAIRAALADGRPLVGADLPHASMELLDRVRTALSSDVNPGLAKHGGQAELVGIRDGVAEIRLTGGCQGCGAAKMTLSYGIEQTLRTKIPELMGVRDVTDHAAGAKPYFSSTGQSPFGPQGPKGQ